MSTNTNIILQITAGLLLLDVKLQYWAEWVDGSINPKVHDEIKWASIDELCTYSFAPADLPIVKKIVGDSNVQSKFKG